MGVIAFVAPFMFGFFKFFDILYVGVVAVLWTLELGMTGSRFLIHNLLDPFLLAGLFQVILLRLPFVLQMMQYYQGKTTRNRTLAWGMIADLSLLVITLISILQQYAIESYVEFQIPFPMPILLIVGIFLIRFFPAPLKPIWDLESYSREWWVETDPESQ